MNARSEWRREAMSANRPSAKKPTPSIYAKPVKQIFDRMYAIETNVQENLSK